MESLSSKNHIITTTDHCATATTNLSSRRFNVVAPGMDSNSSASKPTANRNAKETSSTDANSTSKTSSSSSPTSPSPTITNKDHCCVCVKDLPVDAASFARMTCCGKAIHNHCKDTFFESSLSQEPNDKCPRCQVELFATDEELFGLARGWADKGKAWAQFLVGNKYRSGDGVKQSYEKAIEYYTLALHQGDPNAIYELADMYYEGQGVTKSIETAIELYTRAANQGQATAQFKVGVMCYIGDGVDKSHDIGREWWIKAAVQDHAGALQYLQQLDKLEGRTTPTILCCSTCGKPKTPLRPLHPCKLCRTVQYCGRECQVNHWKEGGHRRECKKLREAAAAKTVPKEVE